MRRAIQIILMFLPLLLLSQDTLVKPTQEFITEKIVTIEYQKIPAKQVYKFEATEDLEIHVIDFLKFVDKYNLDPTPILNYEGIYSVNNIRKYTSDTLTIGLTFRGVEEVGVKALSILKSSALTDTIKTKAIVFHEMTHMMTRGQMPHCRDAVNCSVLFYKNYARIVSLRLDLFWEIEEQQLANMIKIYEQFDKKYGK